MLKRMMTPKAQSILIGLLVTFLGVSTANAQSRLEAARQREQQLTERLQREERANPDSINVDRLAQAAAEAKQTRERLERQEGRRADNDWSGVATGHRNAEQRDRANERNLQQSRERQQREFQRDWELGENIRRENERNSAEYHAGRPENRYSVVPMPSTRDIPPRNHSRGVFERNQREGSHRYDGQYDSQQDTRRSPSSGLNRAEMRLYAANPDLIPVVTYYRGVAEKETQRRFGASRRNDASDAFRHAYGAALLSRALGPYYAQMITDAHEMTIGNPDHDRYMDIHNNRIGIRLGQYPQRRGMPSEEELADLTARALRAGWLVFYER